MSTIADKELARFLDNGRPEHIGRVFDEVSPELFKLAVHLSGDVHVAEDLVQQTFLTLLEKLDAFDRKRPLVPWLCGILAFHARARRRKDVRPIDADRYVASRDGNEAGRADAKQAAIEVIERLEEPYRESLLLRFVHGLDAAEIARRLDRSPGTVRVQLHRGIAMLRDLLPERDRPRLTSITGALASSGLGRIRDVILSKAATMTIASSSAVGLIGGLVVMKKIVATVAAVMVLASVLWISVHFAGDEDERLGGPSSSIVQSAVGEPRRDVIAAEVAESRGSTEVAAATSVGAAPDRTTHVVNGRVVDHATNLPLAGVLVRAYGARLGRSDELASKWSGRMVRIFDLQDGTWPIILDDPRALGRAGRALVRIVDRDCAASAPAAETLSDSEGAFRIEMDYHVFLIVCSKDGYATQDRAVDTAKGKYEIRLAAPWKLEGRVVGIDGRPVASGIALRFDYALDGNAVSASQPIFLTIGCDQVNSDHDGRFEVSMVGNTADVRMLSQEWALVQSGPVGSTDLAKEKLRGAREIGQLPTLPWVRVGERDASGALVGPVEIVVAPAAHLRVLDAATRAPIERFSFIARNRRDRRPEIQRRETKAPQGVLSLSSIEPADIARRMLSSAWGSGFEVTVWAPGYRETVVESPSLSKALEVLVLLDRGEVPRLEGRVVENARPLEGVVVTLTAANPQHWFLEHHDLFDAIETDARGDFRFAVAAGKYLLRIAKEGVVRARVVDVPLASPLEIDIAHLGAIEVRVSDQHLNRRSGQIIQLNGADGRSQRGTTSADGLAVFDGLPAGEFNLRLSSDNSQTAIDVTDFRTAQLREGERQIVVFTVRDASTTRRARLVTRPESTMETFKVRALFGDVREFRPIERDGVIPIDLGAGELDLEICSSSGGAWIRRVPKDAPDGFEIVVELQGRGYEGVVVDRGTGLPFPAVKVSARPIGSASHEAVQTVTDDGGNFRITGCAAVPSFLHLEVPVSTKATSRPVRKILPTLIVFVPEELPADPPTGGLRIELPSGLDQPTSSDRMTLRGRLERRGTPLGEAFVLLDSIIDQPGGALHVRIERSQAITNAEGEFALEAIPGTRYVLTAQSMSPPQKLLEKEIDSGSMTSGHVLVIEVD